MKIEITKSDSGYTLKITADGYIIERKFDKADEQSVKDFASRIQSFENDGRLTAALIDRKKKISAMESCTGGLFSSNITDYEGASAIFRGSFVTYSNEAKTEAGVPEMIIAEFGVYSPETAYSMARAARKAFSSNIAVGITGSFSNPDPENADSVTGEIYVGIDGENGFSVSKITLTALEKTRKELKKITVDTASALVFASLDR